MNNDYIWDKTGGDAGVEELERLLAVYRYTETDAPEIPALNIVPVTGLKTRRRFSLVFAFGAAAAVVLVGVLYFRSITSVSGPSSETAAVAKQQRENPGPRIENPALELPLAVQKPDRSTVVSPKIVHVSQKARRTRVNRPIVAGSVRVQLTREELYAYNQVKLALFITGTKLKTVSDAIDNLENKETVSPIKEK
jgi:hypothetical protein